MISVKPVMVTWSVIRFLQTFSLCSSCALSVSQALRDAQRTMWSSTRTSSTSARCVSALVTVTVGCYGNNICSPSLEVEKEKHQNQKKKLKHGGEIQDRQGRTEVSIRSTLKMKKGFRRQTVNVGGTQTCACVCVCVCLAGGPSVPAVCHHGVSGGFREQIQPGVEQRYVCGMWETFP